VNELFSFEIADIISALLAVFFGFFLGDFIVCFASDDALFPFISCDHLTHFVSSLYGNNKKGGKP